MAISNHERVGKAMDLLKEGLGSFVERELQNAFHDKTSSRASLYLGEDRLNVNKPVTQWDVSALLKLMWEAWNDVFKRILGFSDRSLVSELRDFRNRWAHQQSFSSDDTYRVLDSAGRLLNSVSASQADVIEKMKTELLRLRFDEQVRNEKRKSAVSDSISEMAYHLKTNQGDMIACSSIEWRIKIGESLLEIPLISIRVGFVGNQGLGSGFEGKMVRL